MSVTKKRSTYEGRDGTSNQKNKKRKLEKKKVTKKFYLDGLEKAMSFVTKGETKQEKTVNEYYAANTTLMEKSKVPTVLLVGKESNGKSCLLGSLIGANIEYAISVGTKIPIVYECLRIEHGEQEKVQVCYGDDQPQQLNSIKEISTWIKEFHDEKFADVEDEEVFDFEHDLVIRIQSSKLNSFRIIDLPGMHEDNAKELKKYLKDVKDEFTNSMFVVAQKFDKYGRNLDKGFLNGIFADLGDKELVLAVTYMDELYPTAPTGDDIKESHQKLLEITKYCCKEKKIGYYITAANLKNNKEHYKTLKSNTERIINNLFVEENGQTFLDNAKGNIFHLIGAIRRFLSRKRILELSSLLIKFGKEIIQYDGEIEKAKENYSRASQNKQNLRTKLHTKRMELFKIVYRDFAGPLFARMLNFTGLKFEIEERDINKYIPNKNLLHSTMKTALFNILFGKAKTIASQYVKRVEENWIEAVRLFFEKAAEAFKEETIYDLTDVVFDAQYLVLGKEMVQKEGLNFIKSQFKWLARSEYMHLKIDLGKIKYQFDGKEVYFSACSIFDDGLYRHLKGAAKIQLPFITNAIKNEVEKKIGTCGGYFFEKLENFLHIHTIKDQILEKVVEDLKNKHKEFSKNKKFYSKKFEELEKLLFSLISSNDVNYIQILKHYKSAKKILSA